MFHRAGYVLLYNMGNVNKNDGVLVYVRDYMLLDHQVVSLGCTDILVINLNINGLLVTVSAIYRSPYTGVRYFIEELEVYLHNTRKNRKPYINVVVTKFS